MKRKTLKKMCEEAGIGWGAFCYRHYSMGEDIESALARPVMTKKNQHKRMVQIYNMKSNGMTSRQIARELGVTPECVNENLRRYRKNEEK